MDEKGNFVYPDSSDNQAVLFQHWRPGPERRLSDRTLKRLWRAGLLAAYLHSSRFSDWWFFTARREFLFRLTENGAAFKSWEIDAYPSAGFYYRQQPPTG